MITRIRTYLAALILTTALMPTLGCGANAQEVKQQQADEPNQVEILYNSVLAEYRDRSWPIAISSPEKLIVASEFMDVNERIRRRYISRIIVMPAGIALNVTAEYQELAATEPPVWSEAEDMASKGLARKDEQELNDRIQARFRALSD